jgi:hypothetical protein
VEGEEQKYNIVTVALARGFDMALARRAMVTSASCGICGTESIDQLLQATEPVDRDSGPTISAKTLMSISDSIRAAQPTFDRTGGLHAAALFDSDGAVSVVREDIGPKQFRSHVMAYFAVAAYRLKLSRRQQLLASRLLQRLAHHQALLYRLPTCSASRLLGSCATARPISTRTTIA